MCEQHRFPWMFKPENTALLAKAGEHWIASTG